MWVTSSLMRWSRSACIYTASGLDRHCQGAWKPERANQDEQRCRCITLAESQRSHSIADAQQQLIECCCYTVDSGCAVPVTVCKACCYRLCKWMATPTQVDLEFGTNAKFNGLQALTDCSVKSRQQKMNLPCCTSQVIWRRYADPKGEGVGAPLTLVISSLPSLSPKSWNIDMNIMV